MKQFFKWAAEAGEIADDPMVRVERPMIPEAPPAMLSDDRVKRLLRSCEGKDFTDRRDNAILFFNTGMRRSELAYLKLADVDMEHNLTVVMGKGRRPRVCPFGRRTAQAIDRHLRVRAGHRHAGVLSNLSEVRSNCKLRQGAHPVLGEEAGFAPLQRFPGGPDEHL